MEKPGKNTYKMNYNRVILIGKVASPIDTKVVGPGRTATNFRLATEFYFKRDDGSVVEGYDLHQITAWGKMGEDIAKRSQKGKIIMIEGTLKNRTHVDRGGKERRVMEIHAQSYSIHPRDFVRYQDPDSDEDLGGGIADFGGEDERSPKSALPF